MNSPKQNPDGNHMDQLTDTQEFLNRLYIFSGAPAGVVKLFAYLAKKETYTKGQHILKGGDPCDRCFFIMSGKVDIHHESPYNHQPEREQKAPKTEKSY